MDVIVYSTGCPKCNVLMRKLENNGIRFSEITDENRMTELGITHVPVLSVDGELKDFSEAISWLNSLGGQGVPHAN